MKKNILIIVSIFFLFSCSKKEENITPSQNLKIDTTECDIEEWDPYFLLAGEEHNNAVAYVYDRLCENKEDLYLNYNNKEDFHQFAKDALIEYINLNENFNEEEKQLGIEQVGTQYANAVAMHENPSLAYETLWPPSEEGEFTSYQLELFSQIDAVLMDTLLGLTASLDQLLLIEGEAREEMEVEDNCIILFTISVARNSLAYWYQNLDDWEILFDEFKGSKSGAKEGWFSWKSVGKEDVKGAVGGGTAVGVAACFGPVGAGAAATGIIGGAASFSVVEAVDQLWDHWFGESKK